MERLNIDKRHFCLGCGLCATALGPGRCRMQMGTDGFYHPEVEQPLSADEDSLVSRLCPGIHVEGEGQGGYWGPMLAIAEGWSADAAIRHNAASGGVVTALALYLLESGQVDGILQVGCDADDWSLNRLQCSTTRAEVLRCAQSRYAPALIFDRLQELLDARTEGKAPVYAFVGKPCDIAGLKNFLRERPQYQSRIRCTISIFCAGMPSINATYQIVRESGRDDSPLRLRYRGVGWPGKFRAEWADGTALERTYQQSWGGALGRSLGIRCKACPDGIGMLADISVGDSWNTLNGYPDFTEDEGRCFVMLRTAVGQQLYNDAIAAGYVVSRSFDVDHIPLMQAYQYKRRKSTGWRIFSLQLQTHGMLRFRHISVLRNALRDNPVDALKNFFGMFLRYRKACRQSNNNSL